MPPGFASRNALLDSRLRCAARACSRVEGWVPDHHGGVIAWLGEAVDPAALGGKGASLDRLIRMGFRVPPGFCLTTDAFRAQWSSLEPDDPAVRRSSG